MTIQYNTYLTTTQSKKHKIAKKKQVTHQPLADLDGFVHDDPPDNLMAVGGREATSVGVKPAKLSRRKF
jgi:hypothetical protein